MLFFSCTTLEKKMKYSILCLLLMFKLCGVQCFDIFWGATAGVAGVIDAFTDYPKNVGSYAKCATRLYECCDDNWIIYNMTGLRHDLHTNVFGQHIVEQYVSAALEGHRYSPSKPLVMSFHGWPGGGKNYVSQFIAKNMFFNGVDSKFYHYINGRTNYPLESKVYEYQNQLRKLIIENTALCGRSLFVIDEVDKMAPGVLDGIKPYLDYHPHVGRIDYRNVVFVFLSNTGGTLITDRYLELWRNYGKSRNEMTLVDFDYVLGRGAFNEKGGLHFSDIIDHSLIDHYLPFLPLEKEHVEKCIVAETRKYNYRASPNFIRGIMENVVFGPNPEKLFATTGCKRLSQKVASTIQKMKIKDEF